MLNREQIKQTIKAFRNSEGTAQGGVQAKREKTGAGPGQGSCALGQKEGAPGSRRPETEAKDAQGGAMFYGQGAAPLGWAEG